MNREITKSIRIIAGMVLVAIAIILVSGCGKSEEKIVTNKDDITAVVPEDEDISLPSAEDEDLFTDEIPKEDPGASSNGLMTGMEAVNDTFEEAVAYIKRSGGNTPQIDLDSDKFEPKERDKSLETDKHVARDIESGISEDEKKTVRMIRSGNGATLDFVVYTDPEDRMIDKIVSTEYGSEGREINGYYYKNGKLVYAYRYLDDLYGINADNARKAGGQRCYFINDFMAECYATYGESNESVTAATYDDMNPDIQKEYDELEKKLLNRAYASYYALRTIPSTAKICGYVADEYGGTLANARVTVMSEANGYSESVDSNGDGYYEITVPVNTADWYNMKFEYGDFAVSKVNDVYIRPGTIEYPIGVTYMAPEGLNVHDTDTYLLDVTKQSPDKLKENQYEVTFSYNSEKISDLKPFALDINSGKYENNENQIITVDSDTDVKYFITDQKNGRSGNNLTNDMSLSEVQVKVYNRNGLVASFQVPVGKSGVVWEVFEVRGSEIVPSNNYYFETGKDIFF